MPISFEIHDNPPLVSVTFEGHVTFEESAESFVEFLCSGAAYSGRPVLLDSSAVTVLDIDFEGMLTFIAEKVALLDPYERTMIMAVVSPDPQILEQWKEYELLISQSDRQIVRVFKTHQAALEFLGVDQTKVLTAMNQS